MGMIMGRVHRATILPPALTRRQSKFVRWNRTSPQPIIRAQTRCPENTTSARED
jgi:hypothetical protein